MTKITSIRTAPEPEEKPRELTPKEQEQIAYRTGNRKTRRMIAKRNKFFKDKSGTAWRESNRMIRTDDTEVKL